MNPGISIGSRRDLIKFFHPAPQPVRAEFYLMPAGFSRKVRARRPIQGNGPQFFRPAPAEGPMPTALPAEDMPLPAWREGQCERFMSVWLITS